MPETVLQFGAGRFLRGFIDRFMQNANDEGQNVGSVVVVQSTPGDRADRINQQPNGYHVLVRGYDDGQLVERLESVRTVRRALVASQQWDQVRAVAEAPSLRYLVSNATEAGYGLDPDDKLDSPSLKSLPAKLTQVLWWRFQARQSPVVLLPCELIERNAIKLMELIQTQIKNWSLPQAFSQWVSKECLALCSLVDCIITSPPADHPVARDDKLLVCAEPYALWALEKPKDRDVKLFQHRFLHLVDELAPFFLRKVRILNGIHSCMVAKFLPAGYKTVKEVLDDPAAVRWVRAVIFEEIVPVLAYCIDDVSQFADQTWDRLRNPFTIHRLSDIALNHAAKIQIRLKPTIDEYTALFGKSPKRLTEVMAVPIG